ncbi:TetR/AcrR family transcriptional regulator [Nocardia huaxiensis]|uniref:TetR/AcrR family transcriptional regulator n=1 Tax=Nocardia huaxiensis TaxID=2755382 RepID=A0A7D6V9U4_9NOCA|nr:TetR/AcrR family transcriptional regulator [Nocardia huaxiensis]QLY31241.1 TetR/AcrR family transcriptional regulator [Nocardia huaxiensis]UFS94780.1 TetR/AcrR family transcriptional regulator [Nocardia huaxiensis]
MTGRAAQGAVVAGRSTKDAIREAAIQLFSAKGFEQSSLREVADAVGITKASLYYHYASKVDLLVAIIEPIFDDMRALVDSLDGREHTPDAVRAVLTAHLEAGLHHRAAGVLCMRDTVAIVNALGNNRYPDMLDMHRRMCEWLAGPGADEERKLRAAAAMQVLSVALTSQEHMPDTSPEVIERVLLNAALGVLDPE